MSNLFTDHPRSVGETYGQHCLQAMRFAFWLSLAALAALVHALLPFMFEKTASRLIESLYQRMVTHRRQTPAPSSASTQAVD